MIAIPTDARAATMRSRNTSREGTNSTTSKRLVLVKSRTSCRLSSVRERSSTTVRTCLTFVSIRPGTIQRPRESTMAAPAGIGTLGIIDDDVVSRVVHGLKYSYGPGLRIGRLILVH